MGEFLGEMPSIVSESRPAKQPIDEEGKGKSRAHIYLNIYDLTPVNNYLYWFGFGIFHSGIEGKKFDSLFFFCLFL